MQESDTELLIQTKEDHPCRLHPEYDVISSTTTHDISPSPVVTKILFLDGVRGTAVIFVVTEHAGYMRDLFMGAVGVDAFFVLSSFLLTMIFMKKSIKLLEEQASYHKWGWTLADYFSKRFFRVYPLFALLSLVLWLMPFEYKNRYYRITKPEDFNLFLTLTFHPEHRHYVLWTLPLEIAYYFIIPTFVFAVLKLGRFWWVLFIPLYAWVIYEGLYSTRDNFHHQPLSKHLPTFTAGSMTAAIFVKVEAWIKKTGFNFSKLPVIGLRVAESTLVALYLSVVFRGLFFNWLGIPLPRPTRYSMPFTSVNLSLILVIEMLQPSSVSMIFEWTALRYLGKISFSVYLLHVFVIFTPLIQEQADYYDKMFAVFGLAVLLATASYYSIEYPSQLLSGWKLMDPYADMLINPDAITTTNPDANMPTSPDATLTTGPNADMLTNPDAADLASQVQAVKHNVIGQKTTFVEYVVM
ncbi:hypothetical protein PHYSODRAFT_340669 [Phytophthora sojae]|uniref:Acyltransferase 3 domain-containing protein n=1 Tax=Phytophthora sojae (strain P6497) TaxID=1094619 RepID=G5AAH7_PHYSP|nr:hypothetical protein PHYSODRAFT_340669 [Phytophthora sojae]EGZ07606.1 hypothetical protein PHYSODRAFT_340669 [Phytophthora sojae]|eukprot:XP_009537172.1 hypothetical protein PHYSODRAFT_340669 [Phytophthora sojae]